MNRYQPQKFRPAFGIAAAAMSAITLAVLVVLPVSLATPYSNDGILAAAPTTVRTVTLDPVVVVAQRGAQAS